MTTHCDILVVGGGPAGCAAATEGAARGARVVVIERDRLLGGAGVHRWWLPSQMLQAAARARTHAEDISVEFASLLPGLDVQRQAHADEVEAELRAAGVVRYQGRAHFIGPGAVEVVSLNGDRRRWEPRTVILATGDHASNLPQITIDQETIVDPWSAMGGLLLPSSLLVAGGGVSATETASVFSRLGVKVTLLVPHGKLLTHIDEGAREVCLAAFHDAGIRVMHVTSLNRARRTRSGGVGCEVVPVGSEETLVLRADKLILGVCRTGRTHGLGLSLVGLTPTDSGHIPVDPSFATAVPGIFAAGAVVGPLRAPEVAPEQGRAAARSALGVSHSHVHAHRYAILGVPEVAGHGWTQEDARDRGGSIHRVDTGSVTGLLICDADGQIVGVHAWGTHAVAKVQVAHHLLDTTTSLSEVASGSRPADGLWTTAAQSAPLDSDAAPLVRPVQLDASAA